MAPFVLLDAKRMPFWLYLPNLIGYVRWATLILAMLEEDPASTFAVRCLVASFALDYVDGPAARKFDMCTQFGDLLDHFADHVTMMWLVHVTSSSAANWWINAVAMVATLGYMAATGHYFKHAATANWITSTVEAHNYFNMPALLWNANTILVPFVKLSYACEHGIPLKESTEIMDLFDYAGLCVTLLYSGACVAAALPQSSAATATKPKKK